MWVASAQASTAAQASTSSGSRDVPSRPAPPPVPSMCGSSTDMPVAQTPAPKPRKRTIEDIVSEFLAMPELAGYTLVTKDPVSGPQMSWELGNDGKYHLVPWTPHLGKVTTSKGRQIPTPPKVEPPPPHMQATQDTASQANVSVADASATGTAVQAPAVEATSEAPPVVSKNKIGRWRSQPSVTPQAAEPLPGATAGGGDATVRQEAPRRAADDRDARMREFERPPLTIEERDELRVKFETRAKQNVAHANSKFPSDPNWHDTYIENERTAAINYASLVAGGHIASTEELDQFFTAGVPTHERMVNLVLELLRDKQSSKSKAGTPHIFYMSNEGWVSCRDLIEAVKVEVVGSHFNIKRLINMVSTDKHRRMQLWVDDQNGTGEINEASFTHVRAVSGHGATTGVDPRLIYPVKTRFDPKSAAEQYRGPDYVYYYTDVAGLGRIWRENGITPECCRFGPRNRSFIFCAPVDVNNPDCPSACKVHVEKFKIQITLDFRMIVWDEVPAFYTSEGLVAIRTNALGAAYIAQIISLETGTYSYLRAFKITDWHWTGRDVIDTADTRGQRNISCERCFVCNTEMWIGVLTCMQCYCPIITERHTAEGFPRFSPHTSTLDDRSMEPWSDAEQKDFREVISMGRRLNGLKFNVQFGIRPPTMEEERNRANVYYRSFRSQGNRTDGDLERKHRMELRLGNTQFTAGLEDRIARDAPFRLKLARAVVACSRHYSPAAILLSRLHRLAYTTAIRYGEISYENVGYRSREIVAVEEQDE